MNALFGAACSHAVGCDVAHNAEAYGQCSTHNDAIGLHSAYSNAAGYDAAYSYASKRHTMHSDEGMAGCNSTHSGKDMLGAVPRAAIRPGAVRRAAMWRGG